ncbi:MAG: IPT/TIG domain-containing protein [Nitrospiraceae bacterium]|nr:IPT/TIG domain-containing protein [Nitrospiraceae bacterium]
MGCPPSLHLLATYCLALFLPIAALADTAEYFYDELSRLIGVADGNGVTAVYNYDAVGNLTSIDRFTPPGSGIGIYLAAPGSGPATTQVTIEGYGFDPTPANNTVQFNGTAATVNSASANTLVVSVPTAATTGSITVTNANGTATSPQSFTVPALPTVTSVDPVTVPPGAASGVQITGTNLLNATAVTFTQGGLSASIRDGGTATTLPISFTVASSVPAGNYAFTVTSPAGSASSGSVTIGVSSANKLIYSTGPLVSVAMPLNATVLPFLSPSGWSVTVAPPTSVQAPYPDVPATKAPSGWSITVAPPTSTSMP